MRITQNILRMLSVFGLYLLIMTNVAVAENGRYALIIGNSDYTSVGNLGNPVRDARAVRKAFERLGFEVIYGENLTREQNIKRISTFLDRKEKIKVAAFYYAGHGIQINGENFIIPVDADIKNKANLNDNVISMNQLLSFMDRRSETSLIFLDACRDNPFKKQIQSRLTRGILQRTRNLGQFDLGPFVLGQSSSQNKLDGKAGNNFQKLQKGRAGYSGRRPNLLVSRSNDSSVKHRAQSLRPKHGLGQKRTSRQDTNASFSASSFTAKSLNVGTGLAEIGGKTGMFVSFATAPGTVAYDGHSRHSPFTEGLLKYIGAKVEINLVATRIRNHVNKVTKGLQVPWSSSSLTEEIYLASLPQKPSARRIFKRSRPKIRSRKGRINKKARIKSRPIRTRTKTKTKRKTKRKVKTRKKVTPKRSKTKRVATKKITRKRTTRTKKTRTTRKRKTVARSSSSPRRSQSFLP